MADELQIAQNNWSAFAAAWKATKHDEFVELADKCDRFYVGDQWDEETLRQLGDRPALTINMSMRTINAILGHYSTSRADIAYKPKRGGATEQQAQTLTRVVDSILDANKYEYVEKQVFSDGIINDRGFFDVRMSFDDNILGEVSITSRDARTVILDPNATDYDPSTWTEVIVTDWYSPDDLEALYGPEKIEELHKRAESGDYYGAKSIRFGGGDDEDAASTPQEERRIRSVRVVDRQYRRVTMVREFVDLATGDTRLVPEHWDEKRVQSVKAAYGLATRKRMAKRIRWTVTADKVVLFDEWSPYDEFTIIPFFPYFRRGKPSGVMRHLLSPQEQLNKTESQNLHIVNTTANSGWVVEEGSLANMDEEELAERASETGLVLTHKRNRPPPQKIQPNQVPTGIENLSRKAAQYVLEIPGAAPLVGQTPKSDVSGVAIQDSRTAALTGLQPVFDNLNFTRWLVGHRILKLVQKFYSEPRLMRGSDWSSSDEAMQQFAINTDLLNNVTIGEYDIKVTNAPARDTFEDTQFAQAVEMRREGIAIPDHFVIETSHLARKKEIAELVKRLQGLAEPTPEQNAMSQMQMQLEMRKALAEVAQIEAAVQKLQAETGLSMAKSQSTMLDAETRAAAADANYQLDKAKLFADLQKQVANLQNKLELAAMHIDAKQQLTRYNRMSQFAEKIATQPQPQPQPQGAPANG